MTQSDQQFIPPPANRDTFKDLLRFEERLKQNAERLQRQRIKYEAFLVSIIIVSLILAYKTFISISQYKLIHFIYVGLLLVSITTLILFFATGMYTDQIAYAYKFIPQTNRALRPFNMFLITPSTINSTTIPTSKDNKVRKMINFLKKLFFFNRISSTQSILSTSMSSNSQYERKPLTPNSTTSSSSSTTKQRDVTIVDDSDDKSLGYYPDDKLSIKNLNPRGEILFSTLVDSQFINQYKLYRNQWEIRQKKLNS